MAPFTIPYYMYNHTTPTPIPKRPALLNPLAELPAPPLALDDAGRFLQVDEVRLLFLHLLVSTVALLDDDSTGLHLLEPAPHDDAPEDCLQLDKALLDLHEAFAGQVATHYALKDRGSG